MSYYSQILKFLKQATSSDLQTKDYDKKFESLNVKVSFGQGNPARIPWIAFLGGGDEVTNGIYPVYLYYKDRGILILSLGVSETNVTKRSWGDIKYDTIEKYFKDYDGSKAARYSSSFVFKVYSVDNLPTQKTIDNDLERIITIYKNTLNNDMDTLLVEEPLKRNLIVEFSESLKKSNLQVETKLIERYLYSLLTKPFVILTGLSGSGKTKLAQSFAQWLCAEKGQYRIIPVGSDWTTREPLLGYPNGLDDTQYVMPESGALSLLIEANKPENSSKPFFLILDEMNLSHVERYFADFLSVMESKEEILLYEGKERNSDELLVPYKLSWPKNLFVVGTINVDETTYMFSPKVLDRANVIEFRINEDEMKAFLENQGEVNLTVLEAKGTAMAQDFLAISQSRDFKLDDEQEINEILNNFFKVLKGCGAEFGYRSASEIKRYISIAKQLNNRADINIHIDAAIMQKLLPKLHGSRKKLVKVLEVLTSLCIDGDTDVTAYLNGKIDCNTIAIKYPISLEKIERMYTSVVDTGYASYAEA